MGGTVQAVRSSVPVFWVIGGKGGERAPSNTYILVVRSARVNLRGGPPGKNVSKCAGPLHTTGHYARRSAWQYALMITLCGHRVRGRST